MASAVGCTIALRHAPRPKTVELHHVIPVAWQLAWKPDVAMFPGPDQDGRGMLWDARTVALCPTHHRNVHFWIVLLMHTLASAKDDNIAEALHAVRPFRISPELRCAVDGLTRFQQAGGSLLDISSKGLFGAA